MNHNQGIIKCLCNTNYYSTLLLFNKKWANGSSSKQTKSILLQERDVKRFRVYYHDCFATTVQIKEKPIITELFLNIKVENK